MRIGLAQINTIVGDLAGNQTRILDAYRRLVADGAEIVVFPELAVCGYPPRDLLFRRRFIADVERATAELAAQIGPVPALIGFVAANPTREGRPAFNAAAFCHHGTIRRVAHKCLLPTYDVFDEDRYFEPAREPATIEFGGRRIGLTICEDIWANDLGSAHRRYHLDPIRSHAAAQVDLMINLSASPWHLAKNAVRLELIAAAARTCGCPIVYCNSVGGNDELVFEGRSVVVDAVGRPLAGLAAFQEELRVVDVAAATPAVAALHPTYAQDELADMFDGLVLGVKDYARKTGFRRALVGLSGGIDSAVVAVLAVAALGAENVTGISLPSAISSAHSRDDAAALARHLGIAFHTISIADTVAAADAALAPQFAGHAPSVAEENIQARARGLLLMAMSNKFNSLLLTTGNKSELAVGYCTLYGDMCGGLAVISDVFKTQVYALSRWINREREIIPQNTIDKAPSAELRPNQTDQESLPPYDQLDAILRGYVEEGLSRADLVAQGFPQAVVHDVVRKVDLSEYKRKQAAPGLKITPLAFGVGRRIPIVQKYVS
ncbi:MAG: NAD+ synthase [Candidatus Didemnitutus sp.]|nr:NAD+ synthase [Candidatus Didemnitutus sp.]